MDADQKGFSAEIVNMAEREDEKGTPVFKASLFKVYNKELVVLDAGSSQNNTEPAIP